MFNLPNLFTLINLFLGCLGVLFLFTGEFNAVMYCLIGSAVADVLDGLIARAMNIKSDMGKELDSIADMVSFGFMPGAIFYVLFLMANNDMVWPGFHLDWQAVPGFLITLFSGLRLAKFNVDTRQSESFLGLPTPSATFFTLGLLMIAAQGTTSIFSFLLTPWVLYVMMITLCFLLVSDLPMFSLKIKSMKWKGNELLYLFAFISLLLVIFFKASSFTLIIGLYILTALFQFIFKSKA